MDCNPNWFKALQDAPLVVLMFGNMAVIIALVRLLVICRRDGKP